MKPHTVHHNKPQSLVWEHFEVLDGGKKIKCKLCPPDDAWESVHNATRASKHLGDKHKLGVQPKLESEFCSSELRSMLSREMS